MQTFKTTKSGYTQGVEPSPPLTSAQLSLKTLNILFLKKGFNAKILLQIFLKMSFSGTNNSTIQCIALIGQKSCNLTIYFNSLSTRTGTLSWKTYNELHRNLKAKKSVSTISNFRVSITF